MGQYRAQQMGAGRGMGNPDRRGTQSRGFGRDLAFNLDEDRRRSKWHETGESEQVQRSQRKVG
jgi:hypothetical protein